MPHSDENLDIKCFPSWLPAIVFLFFCFFWISCEVSSLQGCQAETAADRKDHIYVPVGIMQGIFSLSSTSERLRLYSKCLASV